MHSYEHFKKWCQIQIKKDRAHIPFSVSFLTQSGRNEGQNGTDKPRAQSRHHQNKLNSCTGFYNFYTWMKDLLFALPFQTCSAEFLTFLVSQCDRNQKQSVLQQVITGWRPGFTLGRDHVPQQAALPFPAGSGERPHGARPGNTAEPRCFPHGSLWPLVLLRPHSPHQPPVCPSEVTRAALCSPCSHSPHLSLLQTPQVILPGSRAPPMRGWVTASLALPSLTFFRLDAFHKE